MTSTLVKLNDADAADALAMLEPLVERSPWVAAAALSGRPFPSDEALAEALFEVILSSDVAKRIALLNAHPELAGEEATAGDMTEASTDEQSRLGLNALAARDAERLETLNALYRDRFGHPFIIALHRVPDLETLFASFERRLTASPLEEHITALAEIASVIRSRARQAFGTTERLEPATEPSIKEMSK